MSATKGQSDNEAQPPTEDVQADEHPSGKIKLMPGVHVGARTFALIGLAVAAGGPITPSLHPTATIQSPPSF